jgi:hypothetical protein
MVAFVTLWNSFPDADSLKAKCFNKQAKSSEPFENYCAILLSECFLKSGIDLSKCPPGHRCWSHSGPRHVLIAEHLAKWLADSPPAGFGKREKIDPVKFQSILAGRTGVVFFKDYWQRGRESSAGRSGDHIDLWSKSRITGGSMFYRGIIEFLGLVSDLNQSREIWFWEVK